MICSAHVFVSATSALQLFSYWLLTTPTTRSNFWLRFEVVSWFTAICIQPSLLFLFELITILIIFGFQSTNVSAGFSLSKVEALQLLKLTAFEVAPVVDFEQVFIPILVQVHLQLEQEFIDTIFFNPILHLQKKVLTPPCQVKPSTMCWE